MQNAREASFLTNAAEYTSEAKSNLKPKCAKIVQKCANRASHGNEDGRLFGQSLCAPSAIGDNHLVAIAIKDIYAC